MLWFDLVVSLAKTWPAWRDVPKGLVVYEATHAKTATIQRDFAEC